MQYFPIISHHHLSHVVRKAILISLSLQFVALCVLSQSQNGQKRYQVNLRSHSTPIQVLLINRDTCGSRPVVFSVPPPDDVCAMPTPPSTPASLQKYPITSESCSLEHSHLKSPLPEHQLTPLSTPPDVHMGIKSTP